MSDEQVDVTIPAAGVLYVISDPETIHIELPAATVQSKQTVSQVDPSSFIIRANPGAVTIAGGDDERACDGASACVLTMSEGMLVAGVSYYTFTITLTHEGEWLDGTAFDANVLLGGLRSLQSEPFGFNRAIAPQLLACYHSQPSCAGSLTGSSIVERQSGTVVVVKIGDIPTYSITAPETISVRLSGSLM